MPRIGLLFELRQADTRPGEGIRVVGDQPELGAWDPFNDRINSALEMRTTKKCYPRWGSWTPVWIELTPEGAHVSCGDSCSGDASVSSSPPLTPRPAEAKDTCADEWCCESGAIDASKAFVVTIEYKYVKDRLQLGHGGPSIEWEDRIANRRVTLPLEPGSIWEVSDATFNVQEAPKLSRVVLPEVVKRWWDSEPEWTSCDQQERGAPEWSRQESGDGDLASPRSEMTCWSGHTTSTIFG